MEDNIKQERIELYLTGQLKDKDLKEFEQTLESNEAFAQDVEIMRDLEEAMDDFEYEKELSSKLKFLGKKYITEDIVEKKSTTRVVPIFRKRWFVAATILLVVIAGGLLFQNAFQLNANTDLFATYYKSYPSDLLTRGENDNAYSEIVELYNENDFIATVSLLEKRLTNKPNDTASKILLGNSYLSLEPANVEKAIETFKPLADDKKNVYNETAQWYLALSYIQNKQNELAEPILKSLSLKEYGKYPKLAKELLKEL
jgi:cytochrome c-type biogenesis protein CcmH/NrfG